MGKRNHAHHRSFFTAGEREGLKNRYGTVAARLGEDSQVKFDACGLCLSRLRDPVATPSGYLFCRGCILSYLIAQKEVLAEKRKEYEAVLARRKETEDLSKAAGEAATVQRFVAAQDGLAQGHAAAGGGHAESEARRKE